MHMCQMVTDCLTDDLTDIHMMDGQASDGQAMDGWVA